MEKLHADEKGSPYYEKNRVKGSEEESLEMLYKAIDLIKEGKLRNQVVDELLGCGFKITLINEHLNAAYSVISTEYLRSETGVFNIHLERYTRDINSLFNKSYQESSEDWMKLKSYHQNLILEILEAKERLLGFHKAGFHITLNQQNIASVKKQSKQKYDISKLSWDEKLELMKLFDLTRRDEIFSIQESKIEKAVEVQEAEVIEEEPNITRVKHKKLSPEEEFVKTYTGLTDTFAKMKETFDNLAKQKLRDAGSKTV